MKVLILKEGIEGERRVAITPETVKKMKMNGVDVFIVKEAGKGSLISDDDFADSGATILSDPVGGLVEADVVLKIHPPTEEEIENLKSGSIWISTLKPFESKSLLEKIAEKNVSAFSLEMIPRISRAQSMDILSSQANLAGYKSVLMAAEHYQGLFPMLMTAAGTIRPAKVLVLGVGVAGLQAIATAKRLGAQVSAFDIRSAVKDQVKSLGAKFIEIDLGIEEGEGKGGYARELTPEERKKQIDGLGKVVEKMDIVITTAAVFGRPAPKLISENTIRSMARGSIIVDLASESGGNSELTQPGKVVVENGVTIIGTTGIPSLLSVEASKLFSRNVWNFLQIMLTEEGSIKLDREDEIIQGSLICHEGNIVHPSFTD